MQITGDGGELAGIARLLVRRRPDLPVPNRVCVHHGRSWTDAQLLRRWKVLPARAESAIRRVKWWQAMTEHNHAQLQTVAAIWGQLPDGPQTLTTEGVLVHSANSFAIAFSEDLHLFTGLSGTEDFFELWEAKTLFLWCPFSTTKTPGTPSSAQTPNSCEQQHSPNTLGYIDGKDNTSLRPGGSKGI